VIGRGSFGKVYLVQKKDNDKLFAMKTLKKDAQLMASQY
jgi:serine/threonine protein kinase